MCTTFILQNDHSMLLGQNYDFYYGHGLIVIGKRDIRKESLKVKEQKSKTWTSNYGSVTFTQFGRELPMSGMNEKGLAVAMMYHDEGQLPEEDGRTVMNELQWMQYQLDQFATVAEVLDHLEEIRIIKSLYALHYTVADALGNVALIEFIKGTAQVIHDEKHFVLANNSFKTSKQYAEQIPQIPLSELSRQVNSLDRFTLAYRHVEHINSAATQGSILPDEAFHLLKELSVLPSTNDDWGWAGEENPPTLTYWSIVFDLKHFEIHYIDNKNKHIRTIELNSINFSKTEPALCLRVDNNFKGCINARFNPYTTQENERIVQLSFKPIRDIIPLDEQLELIVYPDRFT